MFAVSGAKAQILQQLAKQNWTPTDLADELEKSTESIYNHLHDLEEQGILQTRTVAAKTRPKTEYSIGNGLIQYVAVLPGQYQEGAVQLDAHKEAVFRIWMLAQDEFHPYLERYWWRLRTSESLSFDDEIVAVGVYGSVGRGDADQDSDVDVLVIVSDATAEETVNDLVGTVKVDIDSGSKICMTETYTITDFRNSLAHGSDFLENIRNEVHIIYDPDRILVRPETVVDGEF